MNTINMKNLGLSGSLLDEACSFRDLYVGRVLSQSKDLYRVVTERGEVAAKVSGKFRFDAATPSDYPAVGDFVMVDRDDDEGGNAVIHRLLRRKSLFVRRAAGTAKEEQVVAANVDTVFVCMALGGDYNLRRVERYLGLAWSSGAVPVVVLTKADLCRDLSERLSRLEAVAPGVAVVVTSSLTDDGWQALRSYLGPGRTVAFIGSSGVGKSTLINRLVGRDLLATGEVRDGDGRGRHTTTRRELVVLAGGGVVIDTPGMRELALERADLVRTFADIDDLATQCRFRDCTHKGEPGCAVARAVADGLLDPGRLAGYRKLCKEALYEGLHSRQVEAEKMAMMFGTKGAMKEARRSAREKNRRRQGY